MESFFDYYDLHKTSSTIFDKFIKSPIHKTCRFCEKSFPEVTFDTIPHIVPELFGRNKVISNFECDQCNKKFQEFECDTATMIQHYLALLKIKTKNGVPVFQSSKKPNEYSTTLKTTNSGSNINFGTNLSDFKYNNELKTLDINFRTKRFAPYSVYKIFLKMGVSLLTHEELRLNKHYLDFLNSEQPINNGMQIWTAYRYMLKTKYHLTPKINLYKAKHTIKDGFEFPEYVITINFANIIFQFFLPISAKNISEHKIENELRLELLPSFILDGITRLNRIELYNLDLKETRKVSITDTVTLHYSSKIKSIL